MQFTIILVLLATAVSSSIAGGYIAEYRVAKYIRGGANELEKVKFTNELLKENKGQCTGVRCSYEQGSKVIECVINSCIPTTFYSQKCAQVSAATAPVPCYYEHSPAVDGAAYPACCNVYTSFCKGEAGYQESELPKYTAEEIEKCRNTPILISK
ncbi:uncharacterized protein LOC135486674 [Lineus longissimus]|uniref:uncharacterized protein LOC135486674 n=1 Tax=Lineus longissimus TaxID=88925 RepID=UPI002B4C6950